MAATKAAKEALWLKSIVSELDILRKQVVVYCDSHNDVTLAKNHAYSEKLNHIGMRIQFIRV